MARAQARYTIIDEPRPGPLQRLAMNPLFPFIAYMLFAPLGALLFFVNALALRSRTMLLELLFTLIGLSLLGGLIFVPEARDWLLARGWLDATIVAPWAFAIKYLLLVPLAIGMWCGYKVFLWQSATHEVLTYFDRSQRRGGGR
jgi:hypothetical protein